jgi:hypothetical protein
MTYRKPALAIILLTVLAAIGCGGGSSTPPKPSNPTPQSGLVDPSGNWRMTFTDSTGNSFLLSALFNQVGSNVTGINFSEVGNISPNFQCAAQRDISMANGLVQNVNQFSGDLSGNFGTIHFSSTLNDAGTHTSGTYTLTPGANGNCLGIALTGTFKGDEIPSVSGNWTGTIGCSANCPTTGFTGGTISMSLTQDDATGAVTGSYSMTGVPGVSSGQLVADPLGNNFISGSNMQEKVADNNGSTFFLVGGPFSLNTPGLGLDRSFRGSWVTGNSSDPLWTVTMSH